MIRHYAANRSILVPDEIPFFCSWTNSLFLLESIRGGCTKLVPLKSKPYHLRLAMKHPTILLCFLLMQSHLHDVVSKPLALYRVEGSVSNNSNGAQRLAKSNKNEKLEADAMRANVEDFSKEIYGEVKAPKSRELYQRDEERLMQERRDMFIRNLASMSMSMSFAVVFPTSPGPEIGATGTEETEDVYGAVRMKLLGKGSDENFDTSVASSINLANTLASQGQKNARARPVKVVETVSDFSESGEESEDGYGRVRAKLLGLSSDEDFQSVVDADISKANNLAASKMGDMARGGSTRNLRRRLN
jgi:hypothetical protein